MAMPNRDYLFYISLWEENKPHGFVFCRNFQFPSCAMLPSDAGFTYWFSQNCMPAAGQHWLPNIIRYFCQNLHFCSCAMLPSEEHFLWQCPTGITYFISPYGRKISHMDLFFAGISNFQAVLCYPQMLDLLTGSPRTACQQQET